MSAHTTLGTIKTCKSYLDHSVSRFAPYIDKFAEEARHHLKRVLSQHHRNKDIWHSICVDNPLPNISVPETFLHWQPERVVMDCRNKEVVFESRSQFNRTYRLDKDYTDQSFIEILGLIALRQVFEEAGFSVQ